jgi:steroid delta-isomerase-like uncharacterized protein
MSNMEDGGFARALFEAWNGRDTAKILSFYSEEYVGEESSSPGEVYGHEAVRQLTDRFFDAFPDLEIKLVDEVSNAERLAVYWRADGHHRGQILNIPPTGKPVVVKGISFLWVENGKIVRAQHMWDLAGMLRHMGLLPKLT